MGGVGGWQEGREEGGLGVRRGRVLGNRGEVGRRRKGDFGERSGVGEE